MADDTMTMAEALRLLCRRTIDRAVRDVTWSPSPAELRHYVNMVREESRIWIFSSDRHSNSFLQMCEISGQDPEKIRAKVRGHICDF